MRAVNANRDRELYRTQGTTPAQPLRRSKPEAPRVLRVGLPFVGVAGCARSARMTERSSPRLAADSHAVIESGGQPP